MEIFQPCQKISLNEQEQIVVYHDPRFVHSVICVHLGKSAPKMRFDSEKNIIVRGPRVSIGRALNI